MVGAILGGLSVIGNLFSTGMQARGIREQAQDDAEALDENARLSRIAASDALLRGTQEAARARMAGTQAIGAQQVAFGASGIDGSVGSAAALAVDSRVQSELDAKRLVNNAAREAWGLKRQASMYERQSKQALRAGRRAADGAVLGGLAGATQNYGSKLGGSF